MTTNRLVTKDSNGAYRDDIAIMSGIVALDGSNPTPVTTGLTTILGFALSLSGSTAPGVSTQAVSGVISGGTLNIYGWKATTSDDNTLIASTGTENIEWMAFGII